jgi:RNA polymerase sigma factor (sigma-70 family)
MLAERYQPVAFQLACLIARDPREAEDVTQDAWLKAYVAMPRFDDQAAFRPWLLQIVANEARNRRRSAGRRAHLAARVAAAESGQDAFVASPEVITLAHEERRQVLAEVAALREEDRVAIAGRYFLDLTEAEIADLLGCARGTVKSRLSRSLERLRRRLGPREAVALLVILALLASGVLAWPEARQAIADRLGLRGVSITHLPAAPSPVVVPTSLGLGEAVTAEVAAERLGRELLVPSALGPPDAVYATAGEVWLGYAPRADLPHVSQTPGLGLLLTEFGRGAFQREFLAKGLPPATQISDVTVGDRRGVWISGAPHVFFRTSANQVETAPPRLAGNTLLWEQEGMTLRIESALGRDDALRIANSVGPARR